MCVWWDAYAAFARGDVAAVLGVFDPKIEWRQTEGIPTSRAASQDRTDAVPELVHGWVRTDGFTVPRRAFDAGTVVVEGRYTGTHGSGKTLDAQACHVWSFRDGKIGSSNSWTRPSCNK
jgi:ketosteroid isomerase-like protein